MPKFKFDVQAPLDSATAYGKIKNLLSGENDFKKFDPKVACDFDDPSKKCQIKGSQFKASLAVLPKDAQPNSQSSNIAIEVEVPLALSLFKGKIQEAIEKNLKRIL